MTKFKVLTIPAIGSIEDEQEANTFMSQHKIINIDRQFVNNGQHSFWSLCIHYALLTPGSEVQSERKKARIDYKDVLSEEDFAKFAALREVRKALAERDGVPVFGVFNNEQLAQMVQKKVCNVNQMLAIEGIGASKMERFGRPVLAKLNELFQVNHA